MPSYYALQHLHTSFIFPRGEGVAASEKRPSCLFHRALAAEMAEAMDTLSLALPPPPCWWDT